MEEKIKQFKLKLEKEGIYGIAQEIMIRQYIKLINQ
jgi:hypothetical protein